MKKCSTCGIEKPHSEFHRQADAKDGLCSFCKPCKAIKKRAYYERNREAVLSRLANYRLANPEKVSQAKKAARLKKIDEYNAKARENYLQNREERLASSATYRQQNRELILARGADYRERTRERRNEYQRAYQAENREARQAYRNDWKKRRKKSDPVFWLIESARSRIAHAFRNQGYKKTSKTFDMIGCGFDELTAHLESKFSEGMNWGNRGEWEIDHITPLASAKSVEELMALCHYTNLQPLWQAENRKKAAKIAA